MLAPTESDFVLDVPFRSAYCQYVKIVKRRIFFPIVRIT